MHAVPRHATLGADVHTGETGRSVDSELTYLRGDVPEVTSWPQMRPYNPVRSHPDDENYHNGHLRTAARSSGPGDPTAYLVGLDSHATPPTGATGEAGNTTVYGDETGRTMSPRR